MNTIDKQVNQRSSQLKSLTSLRFFAAIFIFILHATNHNLLPATITQYFDLSKSVSFFFVLSGFVLGYAYHSRTYSLFSFYRARFARVWPVTTFSILLVLFILPRSLYLPEAQFENNLGPILFISILCLQSWFPIPSVFFSFNAVTWSVSVEAFFYACFPFLNKLSFRSLSFLLLSLFAINISTALFVSFSSIPGFASSNLNSFVIEGILYINPFYRLPEFVCGIIASKIYLHRSCFDDYLKSKPPNRFLVDILSDKYSIFIFPVFIFLGFTSKQFGLYLPLEIIINQMLSGLIFSFLIVYISLFEGFIVKILSWKPLVFLGEISFGIYLFHQPLMISAAQNMGITLLGVQILPPNIMVILIWTIVLSTISHLYFELPVRAAINSGSLKP